MSEPLPVPSSDPQAGVPAGETTPARGKLKIFFGAFPGAGKTYAMLAAGRRLRDAGHDVVIGVVNTHEAADTEALLKGVEAIAPPVVDGSARVGELDLDRVIARHPAVVLIDNLAHANPEGARHPHRWNDVDEILGNGIDVFTTMSVQHLDSLADVVGEITGIAAERETIPDTFFDSAEETVIVDMSADELLARLQAGKVPSPEVKSALASKFFRKGNLLALREIALRRTADVVEDEVQRYRAEKAIDAVWKTQGNVLCCIGPAEGGEHVVRSAARLANQLDVPWTAAYVETPKLQRLPAEERARILQVVSLAEELGARTAILTGGDAAEAIIDYARTENISTILLGRGSRPRFHVLRSLSERLAAESEDIDLIEIGAAGKETGPRITTPAIAPDTNNPRAAEKRMRYAWTMGISLAATSIAMVLDGVLPRGDPRRGALGPRAGDLRRDPERGRVRFLLRAAHLFAPRERSRVPLHLRRDARRGDHHRPARGEPALPGARRSASRAARAHALRIRARPVAEAHDEPGDRDDRALHVAPVPRADCRARAGRDREPRLADRARDDESVRQHHGKPAGAGTNTMASNEHLFLPLRSPTQTRGVLAIRPERTRDLMIPEQRHQFDIFAALVATALERVHYVDVARDALLMARIQSGDMALELHPKPIAELAEGAIRSLGATVARHPVAIDIPRDLPVVAVDAKLMERVFMSLIGNVPKHTPAGTHVTVSARLAGDFVEVSVADDGQGLPKGREEEIFESFARGDANTQSPKRGAGLGLAIVRAIVEAHGGSIHAEKNREKGARIIFTLPLKRA